MRRALISAVLLLSACHSDPASEDSSSQDQNDVAMVEKANNTLPPLEEVEPQAFEPTDIAQHDLTGEQCNFAPGTSLGTRVVTRAADAFVKINGEVERFAADPGSRELAHHSRSLYSSKQHALRVQMGDKADDGSVELRDVHGRLVYQGTGPVSCTD